MVGWAIGAMDCDGRADGNKQSWIDKQARAVVRRAVWPLVIVEPLLLLPAWLSRCRVATERQSGCEVGWLSG